MILSLKSPILFFPLTAGKTLTQLTEEVKTQIANGDIVLDPNLESQTIARGDSVYVINIRDNSIENGIGKLVAPGNVSMPGVVVSAGPYGDLNEDGTTDAADYIWADGEALAGRPVDYDRLGETRQYLADRAQG